MIPIFKKKRKANSAKPIPQKVKDYILFAVSGELFVFALFYVVINIFGASGISEFAATNLKLAILIFMINLALLPVLIIIYVNHNYSLEEFLLTTRHKRAAMLLLLNVFYFPFYWYKYIYTRNKSKY